MLAGARRDRGMDIPARSSVDAGVRASTLGDGNGFEQQGAALL